MPRAECIITIINSFISLAGQPAVFCSYPAAWSADAVLLSAGFGLLNSFSPQSYSLLARCPVSLSELHDHTERTCLASPEILSLYAHARIHSHTTHSWNADMPAHAQKQKRYRHIYIYYIQIYIYTHRESLVHNHEPRAKALGNYLVCSLS